MLKNAYDKLKLWKWNLKTIYIYAEEADNKKKNTGNAGRGCNNLSILFHWTTNPNGVCVAFVALDK